jgi:hypothetical protein
LFVLFVLFVYFFLLKIIFLSGRGEKNFEILAPCSVFYPVSLVGSKKLKM